MHPILLNIGPLTIHTYGVMLVVAFLAATWMAARIARTWPLGLSPLSPAAVTEWASVTMLGGLLGGRVWYVVQFWEEFAVHPWEILALWHGGLVWYGGFLGGVAATILFIRRRQLPLLEVLDQVIPSVALGHAIGRIGCFTNGCCYGKPTDGWWAIHGLVPTQLLESAGLFVLFLMLRRLQRPAVLRTPGRLFGCYLVGYGILRLLVESVRGDQGLWWDGLTLAQMVSLFAIVGGSVLALRRPHGAHGTDLPIPHREG